MEIELKYNIPNKETLNSIWNNELFQDVEEEESRETIVLNAIYYDTENCDLAKKEIAYRVRREGEKLVAALKWKGHSEDGLHIREEINVPVDSELPDPSVFRESNIGKEVLDFVGENKLVYLLESKVNRKQFRIDTETGLFEFSIDEGEIVTKYGKLPIMEVEIELFSGETEELMKIGKILQEKYNLIEENESKYSRGVKIIKQNK